MVKAVKDFSGRERFKCLKCGSMLSSKCYIREHMKIHTGDKDFKCEQCGKAFRNNFMLKVSQYFSHLLLIPYLFLFSTIGVTKSSCSGRNEGFKATYVIVVIL